MISLNIDSVKSGSFKEQRAEQRTKLRDFLRELRWLDSVTDTALNSTVPGIKFKAYRYVMAKYNAQAFQDDQSRMYGDSIKDNIAAGARQAAIGGGEYIQPTLYSTFAVMKRGFILARKEKRAYNNLTKAMKKNGIEPSR